ncbi:MAG: hypothetical protein WCT04_21185 [Planctomycetota bacterium]
MSTDRETTKPKTKPLSIRDEVLAMADAGDVNGVVDALSTDAGMAFIGNEKPELVRRVIQSYADNGGPAGVINAVLGQMLAFDAELLLWSQARIRQEMRHDARSEKYLLGPSEGLVNEEFPRLARLEDRVILLAKTVATVQHTLALSQPAQKPNGRGKVVRIDSMSRAEAANG